MYYNNEKKKKEGKKRNEKAPAVNVHENQLLGSKYYYSRVTKLIMVCVRTKRVYIDSFTSLLPFITQSRSEISTRQRTLIIVSRPDDIVCRVPYNHH